MNIEEFELLLKSFNFSDSNPETWSNNKRKLHNLPLRHRKKKLTRYDIYVKNKQKIFDSIDKVIEGEIEKIIYR